MIFTQPVYVCVRVCVCVGGGLLIYFILFIPKCATIAEQFILLQDSSWWIKQNEIELSDYIVEKIDI